MTELAACTIGFVLDGHETTVAVRGSELLIDVLRERLGKRGTKQGCGKGECGACTVLVDGSAINSCLMPALEVEGRQVTTIEGLLGPGGALGPLQQAFVDQGGIQCGFCSPGMILSAHSLLASEPRPSEEQIRAALRGNLCRCTGYQQIVASVQRAAALTAGETPAAAAPEEP